MGSSPREKIVEFTPEAQIATNLEGRILLIDDNEQVLPAVADVLRTVGLEVHSFSKAALALDYLANQIPDLIICDVLMPDMDGFSFYEVVQANSEWCAIPFIFLSALTEPAQVQRGKEIGCDDYLTKPFDPTELLAVVRGKLTVSRHRHTMTQERVEAYRRRILHTLSHEFRTPLVAINTGTELLLEQHDALDQERVESLLGSIQRGGHRLQRLVEDFMTLQQIDSGTAALAADRLSRKVEIKTVIETAVELFLERMDEDGASPLVEMHISEKLDTLAIDVYDVHIMDIIQRLLENGYKFGDKEQPTRVNMGSKDEKAWFSVSDRGPGLPNELLVQAQDLFTQINRDKLEQQGCGLGLTIATYYAELNGGLLLLENGQDGTGLTVTVEFPIA